MSFLSPAWKSKNIDKRMAAVWRINDQELLAEIAINALHNDVRLAAIKKITDEKLLTQIQESKADRDIIQAAGDAILALRLSALNTYSIEILAETIQNNEEIYQVRIAAVDHIQDEETLRLLLDKLRDPCLTGKIHGVLRELALKDAMTNADQQALYSIALKSSYQEVRVAAVNRINDEALLFDLLSCSYSDDVLLTAVQNMTTATQLWRVVNYYASKPKNRQHLWDATSALLKNATQLKDIELLRSLYAYCNPHDVAVSLHGLGDIEATTCIHFYHPANRESEKSYTSQEYIRYAEKRAAAKQKLIQGFNERVFLYMDNILQYSHNAFTYHYVDAQKVLREGRRNMSDRDMLACALNEQLSDSYRVFCAKALLKKDYLKYISKLEPMLMYEKKIPLGIARIMGHNGDKRAIPALREYQMIPEAIAALGCIPDERALAILLQTVPKKAQTSYSEIELDLMKSLAGALVSMYESYPAGRTRIKALDNRKLLTFIDADEDYRERAREEIVLVLPE